MRSPTPDLLNLHAFLSSAVCVCESGGCEGMLSTVPYPKAPVPHRGFRGQYGDMRARSSSTPCCHG